MKTHIYDYRGNYTEHVRITFSGHEYYFHADTPIKKIAHVLYEEFGAEDALTIMVNNYLSLLESAYCDACDAETLIVVDEGSGCIICGSATKPLGSEPSTTTQVCSRCGGDSVYFDAYVGVNDPDDVRTFDAVFCDNCGETTLVDDTDSAEED